MWSHECSAQTKRGHQCKRESTTATWCFTFQGEQFDQATWIETCTFHSAECQQIVSILEIGK